MEQKNLEITNKGQITIFSISDCKFCQKSKQMLKEIGKQFNEINLDLYPIKKKDMIEMSQKLSVPQIFIGNYYLGGSDDLEKFIGQNKETKNLDQIIEEQKQKRENLDLRLQIGDLQPVQPFQMDKLNEPYEFENLEINGKKYTFWEIRKFLKQELQIKDRRWHLRQFKNCFLGEEAVKIFQEKFQVQEAEKAEQIGKTLQKMGFFQHVCQDHEFKNQYLFYRLQEDIDQNFMNSYKIFGKGIKLNKDPYYLLNGIVQRFKQMKQSVINVEGNYQYSKIKQQDQFQNFMENFSELQIVELKDFGDDELVAFIINLYNILVQIGYCIIGVPSSFWSKFTYFDRVKVNLGGLVYSLNDLEHGILRQNRKAPGKFSRQFGKNDERLQFMVKEFDCRIHFALNCGAKSCPPVKKYDAQVLREQLQINSQYDWGNDAA
ncbi:Thioredoxin-like fold [Pseudocohnilembus persalinus]|uniref:Thioredoxin-like fold n=1 Tax=Pseudocohnilembus persalinus TaxID=266149 RepID=A0A0V0QT34_PSEPJ|nr:Thioredoxin-like fold [Pseudocohnilembus persalinus]|eukprot:KRX05364.1 Thioredoxin-like fold [Pseudocohnilembus persalinus]